MIGAFLTSVTPVTALATRALIRSLAAHHPDIPVVVLGAEGATAGPGPQWSTAEFGRQAGHVVAETLSPDEQVAFCLPLALHRAAEHFGSVVAMTPGLLATAPLDEVAGLLERHQVVLASQVVVLDPHKTVPELDQLTRVSQPVSGRLCGLRGDGVGLLEGWERAVRQACLDPLLRRPAEVSRVLPAGLVTAAETGVASLATLQAFGEYAAVRSGRAAGRLGSLVEADDLVELARTRLRGDGPVDVELQLLNANVHDSRPLVPLVQLLEAVGQPEDAAPPELSRLEAFRREVRLQADPLGQRWPAGEHDAFTAWLGARHRSGTTRLAQLYWASSPLLHRLPDPRRRPSALRWWNDRFAASLLGGDLFDPSAAPRAAAEPTRMVRAIHWRANVVRGLIPGAAARQQRRAGRTTTYTRMSATDVLDALRWRALVARGVLPGEERREDGPPQVSERPRPDAAEPRAVTVQRPPDVFGNAPRSLSLLGLLRSESGLGQAARASQAALQHLTRPFSYVDTSDLYPSRNAVDPGLPREGFGAWGDVNLIHANAGELVAWRDLVFRHRLAGRFNAAMCFWETANLPVYLRGVFHAVDELWLASSYLADVFGQYGKVPITVIGLAADLPEARQPDRAALGLHSDEFVFLFVYDALSAHGRKNPEKALQAFLRAFGPDYRDVRFVLKVSNLNKFPASEAALRRVIDGCKAITVIDEYLPRAGVLDLMAAADVYVSLHAAEGFGLTLLEAMALGTPVIATAYSGNMDFTTSQNSWLVDYSMVATRVQTGPYPPGSVWASPNVDSAAALMRAARDNPAELARKRDHAVRDARETASLTAYAERLDRELRRVL